MRTNERKYIKLVLIYSLSEWSKYSRFISNMRTNERKYIKLVLIYSPSEWRKYSKGTLVEKKQHENILSVQHNIINNQSTNYTSKERKTTTHMWNFSFFSFFLQKKHFTLRQTKTNNNDTCAWHNLCINSNGNNRCRIGMPHNLHYYYHYNNYNPLGVVVYIAVKVSLLYFLLSVKATDGGDKIPFLFRSCLNF